MMNALMELLHEGKHSLVVKNGTVATFDGRGVVDLYILLTERPDFLAGAEVADKVVGKGAAALMIMGKVRRLHAGVISVPALELLKTASMEVTYGQVVPNIVNRKGDGICPVETLCLPCATAEACRPRIEEFINENKRK